MGNENKDPVRLPVIPDPKQRLTPEVEAFRMADQFGDMLNGLDINSRCLVLQKLFSKILPVKTV